MIPQTLTNIGPYAGLWSDLKSMRHAIDRAMKPDTKLMELDKARLRTLADFLRNELDPKPLGDNEFLSLSSEEPRYSLDIDLRQIVKGLPIFEQWHRSSKMGFKEKTQKLFSALENYIKEFSNSLFENNPPQEEFKIIRAILTELLARTESTLVT